MDLFVFICKFIFVTLFFVAMLQSFIDNLHVWFQSHQTVLTITFILLLLSGVVTFVDIFSIV